jgi:hypothetical protein
MTDTLNLAGVPPFKLTDYDDEIIELAPVHDTAAPNGVVNVVKISIGDFAVHLLPEQAAEFSAAVAATAALLMGKHEATERAAVAGILLGAVSDAAEKAYKAGTYKQNAA